MKLIDFINNKLIVDDSNKITSQNVCIIFERLKKETIYPVIEKW
jgi:hypothetical protein